MANRRVPERCGGEEAPLRRFLFTDDSRGEVQSWSWDFGDGKTSADQHPAHTYEAPGTYTVTLTVTGPGGASDEETKRGYITVTSSDCPIEQAMGGSMGTEGEADGVLADLRAFRDEVLGTLQEERTFVDMYERHSGEVRGILAENPDLTRHMAAFAILAAKAVKGQAGALTLPGAVLSEFLALVEDLKRLGSDALAGDLRAVEAFIAGHRAKAAGNKVRIGME